MDTDKKSGKVKNFFKKFKLETEDVKKFNGPYVNSYLRLIAYATMTVLTGCVYWGWNGIQEMLYKAGSFEELCEGQADAVFTYIGDLPYIDCGLRKSNINNLYTLTFTTHFAFFIIGGILLDVLGPKIVFIGSQAINLLSWMLICTMPKNETALAASFFMIGATAETIFTPLLTVSHYFPKNRSFVISILGSMRSISFVVPTVLGFIFRSKTFTPNSLYFIGIMYGICGNVLCGIAGGYLLQWKFTSPKQAEPSDQYVDLMINNDVEEEDLDSMELTDQEEPKRENRFKRGLKIMSSSLVAAFKHKQLLEFIIVTLSASLFMTGIGFINKSQREIFENSIGETVVDIYKYFNILTFVPAPFLGLVMDRFGPAVVMAILNISGFLFYMLVSFNSYYTKLIACFFYVVAASLCLSSIYCYLNIRFTKKYFGAQLGIILGLIGVLSFTNNPLYDFAVLKLSHLRPFNFRPVTLGLMGYMAFCSIMSFALIYISATTTPEHLKIKNSQSIETHIIQV
ncbi:major facilitator superfamily MFS-1 protein [Theileria orientalis strain Shintoku]|uniref:Major facilitator superfamily MFS-1 protein n=1 Tax=Theileria orientalis strain Shintoku TaxID=869250 RepID=J4CDF9_THEOR|nr:major facilitator superfamily MFS-1 protein [Theileria orientalis strain Shintoku]BAM41072.1 major facilitator superfamily MFS-1 protein [Theileria orientalis strain Shintoku]|eukprot:XP_009691373.1 major facilitator superfamily MFS-1 protein [Theileria orientalis strain Shintoku]